MKFKRDLLLPLIILFVLIIAFIALQPTIKNLINPSVHSMQFEQFVREQKVKKRIDTRAFWQFREFYSPGVFTFNTGGLPNDRLNELLTKNGISINTIKPLVFLSYASPVFQSEESLVQPHSFDTNIKYLQDKVDKNNIITSGENYIIYKESENKVFLIFIATNEEMLSSNGYAFENKEEIKDREWLSVSEITVR